MRGVAGGVHPSYCSFPLPTILTRGIFFMGNIISVDAKILVRLSRIELYLLLQIAAKSDATNEAMIPMRELQDATLFHYQKIHSIRRKLIAKGFLEDTLLNGDTTGNLPQKYVIKSNLISKSV